MDKQDSTNVQEREDDDFAINPDLGVLYFITHVHNKYILD